MDTKNRSRVPFSRICRTVGACALMLVGLAQAAPAAAAPASSFDNRFNFKLVRSPGLNNSPLCVEKASGSVSIIPAGPVEIMNVSVKGLPANTDFDFFVIQVPNKPFGMSWYQGDIETNRFGIGNATFIGRFSIETFMVAPGVAEAPTTFEEAFPSVASNPATGPVQMYHLGLWFDSPDDAEKADCPTAPTPFNGEHNAGPQVLNTSNFPDLQGPLSNVK